jgi:hypothetical protein
MKKLSGFILISFFVFALSTKTYAQLYVRGDVGYGLSNQKILLDEAFNLSTYENIYASFGGNFSVNLGAGMQLNDYIDLGLSLGYQHGHTVAVNQVVMDKTYVGRLLLFNPSITFRTHIYENISPYARLGIFTGLPLTKVLVGSGENKFRGGFPLGTNGALGFDFNFSDSFVVYAELANQSMIYKPTKRREIDGKVVKFTDKYSGQEGMELSHHFFSFGAALLNIGFKIIL